jgi:hypothetical protein
MADTKADIEASPREKKDLLRIRFNVNRWSNQCARHGEPLINPRYFAEIETFLENTRKWICILTLPGFPEDCRLLPPENFALAMHKALDFIFSLDERARSALKLLVGEPLCVAAFFTEDWAESLQEKLKEALSRLDETWDEAVEEARRRLGRKFKQSDYPAVEEIKSQFSITAAIEGGTIPYATQQEAREAGELELAQAALLEAAEANRKDH